jgi:hypothetical protein
MSADGSNNSTQNSAQRIAGTNGRGARAAEAILKSSTAASGGAGKPERAGPSGQSRRPASRDRDNDPTGKNLPLNKAAELLGFETDPDKKSSRRDRSRGRDDDKRDGVEGRRSASDAPADDARKNANRPALELDDDDLDPAEKRAKASKSKTISDMADEMGVDAKELYELSVAFDDDGEPMTIGAMKDRIKEVRDFERSRDDFEDYRTDSMNEVLSARQQIDGVMQRIMSTIPKETLEHHFGDYIQQHQQRVGEARKQLREFFPEWSDASRQASDREALDAHLTTYGFTKFEVDNMQDARLIRFAVHAMRLKDRYDRMKAQLSQYRDKVPTKTPTSRRAARNDPSANAQKQAASGDKIGAVASLIRK